MVADERSRREQVLRAAVLAGDESAWQALYDENFDALSGYVLWRSGGRGDWADEIVQECWLTAVRRIRRFDPGRGTFLDWLRGIAANLVRNQVRRLRRRPQQVPAEGTPVADPGGGSPLEDRETSTRIAAALAALSDSHEAVLRAKYLDGRSVAEIAAAWSQTPKAVESLLGRAREKFREHYGLLTKETAVNRRERKERQERHGQEGSEEKAGDALDARIDRQADDRV